MNSLSRRSFLKSGVAGTALGLASPTVPAALASPTGDAPHEKPVHFLFDGVSLTPLEYSELLVRLCKGQGIATDTYLSGGSVQELETTFARVLRGYGQRAAQQSGSR